MNIKAFDWDFSGADSSLFPQIDLSFITKLNRNYLDFSDLFSFEDSDSLSKTTDFCFENSSQGLTSSNETFWKRPLCTEEVEFEYQPQSMKTATTGKLGLSTNCRWELIRLCPSYFVLWAVRTLIWELSGRNLSSSWTVRKNLKLDVYLV